jgi:hypothetical protein
MVEMLNALGLPTDRKAKDELKRHPVQRMVDFGALVQVTSTQWELTGRGRKFEMELRPSPALDLIYVDAEKVKAYRPSIWEGVYVPPKPIGQRPGADQCKQYPSVQGNRRVFQNGTVEFIG